MSFTAIDTEKKLSDEINDPLTYLFITSDENEVVTSMLKGARGADKKYHSVYIACAVKKKFRNKKLAFQITNYALKEMKKDGVLIARTKIYSWNEASIATIKKCGFEEGGRILMHEYDECLNAFIDDLIFHKVL